MLVPAAMRMAVLVNPTNPECRGHVAETSGLAGRAMGLQIRVLNASTSSEIDAAFATFAARAARRAFVSTDPFFADRRVQLVALATRHAIPAIISAARLCRCRRPDELRSESTDAFRQVGVYTGRILKGAKPAVLPVVQSTKFELVINLKTARTLGLTLPPSLLAIADEVIE